MKKDALGDRLKFIFIWHDYSDLTDEDKANWDRATPAEKEEWLKTHYNIYPKIR